MSCLLAIAAVGLQAATPASVASTQEEAKPFTVTVKQIGTPSWKTFKRVPVEITVTNNTGKTINFAMPYLKNISLWNAKRIGCYIARIAWLTGAALISINTYLILEIFTKKLLDATGLIAETSCATLPDGRLNYTSSSKSLIPFEYDPFGPLDTPLIAFLLVMHSKNHTFPTKSLQPHGRITMQGSISTSNMQKIRDGLTPTAVIES
jgi:hypothetical protein